MEFRTLLFAVIIFGLTSGWVAQWSIPFLFSIAPDKEAVTSRGTVKCRSVRTVLDSKGGPPSCFDAVAEDLANGEDPFREDRERQMEEMMNNPEAQEEFENKVRGMAEQIRERQGLSGDSDSDEAPTLD